MGFESWVCGCGCRLVHWLTVREPCGELLGSTGLSCRELCRAAATLTEHRRPLSQPASPHVSRHCHPSTPPSRPSTHILRQNGKLAYDTMPTATQPASSSAHIHAEMPAVSYRPRTHAASRSIESLEHRPTTRPHKRLCCPSALQQLRPSHPCMSSARSQTRTCSCRAPRWIEGHLLRSEIVVD